MLNRRHLSFTSTLAVALLAAATSNASTILFGPTPYRSQADRPAGFGNVAQHECLTFVEDFEDNAMDPRLTITPGKIIAPGFDSGLPDLTDSVDGDDGAIDGSGSDGHSFFYNLNEISVMFSSPTKAAGLVFTDGPQNMNMTLKAYDAGGNLAGQIDWPTTADTSFMGTAAEDVFVGVQSDGGIAKLVISQVSPTRQGLGIEIDHITWVECVAIPEPASLSLLGFGLLGLFAAFRRGR